MSDNQNLLVSLRNELIMQQWDLKQQILLAQMQTNSIIKPISPWTVGPKTLVWPDTQIEVSRTNCCNCGAPLKTNKCDYCDTINR